MGAVQNTFDDIKKIEPYHLLRTLGEGSYGGSYGKVKLGNSNFFKYIVDISS